MSDAQKRQFERVPAGGVAIRVRFNDVNDLEQYYLRDISRGGIFLRAKNLKPLHSQLVVVLTLPDQTEVRLKGEVVHVVPPEEATAQRPSGMGVQFLDLTPEIKQQLADYVERLKKRGHSQLIQHPDVVPAAAAPARAPQPTPAPVRAPQSTPAPQPTPRVRVPTPNQPIPAPHSNPAEFTAESSDTSGETFEEENDLALLRRLCWLLAEGSVMGRPVREVFGLPSGAPVTLRREVFERLQKALSPDKPPRHLGGEEARAITRLLALLEQLTREE